MAKVHLGEYVGELASRGAVGALAKVHLGKYVVELASRGAVGALAKVLRHLLLDLLTVEVPAVLFFRTVAGRRVRSACQSKLHVIRVSLG